jgi:hypothetical protein
MPCRKVGVFKIILSVVDHAHLLHHAPGAQVLRDGERDQAGERERLKSVLNDGARTLGGEATASILAG